MEFIEAPLFTQLLPEYLTDDEYAKLQVDEEKQQRAKRSVPRRK